MVKPNSNGYNLHFRNTKIYLIEGLNHLIYLINVIQPVRKY